MSFISAAAEQTRDLPLNPYAIGAIALIILLAILFGVLSMGKSRDYKG